MWKNYKNKEKNEVVKKFWAKTWKWSKKDEEIKIDCENKTYKNVNKNEAIKTNCKKNVKYWKIKLKFMNRT